MVKKAIKKVRARTAKGHYQSDDPSTPDVNEAFVSVDIGVQGVGAKAETEPEKKASPKADVIPLVTLEGDRMYPEQAKKYWAKIRKASS